LQVHDATGLRQNSSGVLALLRRVNGNFNTVTGAEVFAVAVDPVLCRVPMLLRHEVQ